jgi:pyruvate dehydrogenase E2 component (dihydrolipoamide acetyltransferase)
MLSLSSTLRNSRYALARAFGTTTLGMPALSPTMAQGNLSKWRKNVGDKVKPGDILCDIETDKATLDFEVQEEGYIAKILVEAGTPDVPVGKPIVLLVDTKEEIASAVAPTAAAAPSAAPVSSAPSSSTSSSSSSSSTSSSSAAASSSKPAASAEGRVFASPYARKVAGEKNIDISQVPKASDAPRVVAADVLAFASRAPSASVSAPVSAPAASAASAPAPSVSGTAFTDMSVTGIRKTIAERLLQSKQTIPHYYLTVEVEVDKVQAVRAELNAQLSAAKEATKLSLNDFVIKAASLASLKVPEANSSWLGSSIRTYHGVDMNVAIATPNGLLAPVIRSTHAKGVGEISNAVRALAEKAKNGKLLPEELSSGTFTISNLGMFGVTQFAAIVNPPQACILAVGAAQKKVFVAEEESKYRTATVMNVTLSCDHRVVDGAVGAQWLQHFKKLLENPSMMLL